MNTKTILVVTATLISTTTFAQKKEASLEMLVPGGKEFRANYPYGAYGTFVDGNKFIKDSVAYRNGNDIAGNTGYEAMTTNGDLFVIANGDTSKVNQVTKEGIVYGTSVHRNEFGIEKGTFWSNNGHLLAFYRMDESMVEKYPIVNITSREATVEPIHYPMAGMTSHEVSIGIYNPATKQTVYLKTESPVNRYFTNVAWSLDDKYITVAEINREQNHMWFNIYDSENGELKKTLFEETNDAWVEPCTPALFISATQFAWISERDGFKHLYLYDINTGNCKQLTKGNWCVSDLYAYNAKAKEIYFQANKESYLCRDIYKVNLKGIVTRLSEGYGVHSAKFSPDLTVYLDNCSSADFAMRSTIRSTKNGKCIETVKEIRDPYEEYEMPQIKTVDLKSADGQFDLTGMLMLPSDFDASKKYPVIIYLYGGPHSQMITAGWLNGVSTWKLALAQRGYIVFTMDNRGTELRGAAYEHAIHRQLGKCEMEDQMVGVNYLKTLPYVDTDRIGIHGWSFGGFMTISMMLNHNDIFKAGVAGGPVCDWSLYEVMYGERYMDTPQENPEGYKMNNISEQTGNLKGRLMVIHGDIDPVVVWQNSLRLLQNAVKNDVLIDYSVYPQHEHNVLGHDRVHLFKKIFQYFDDNL